MEYEIDTREIPTQHLIAMKIKATPETIGDEVGQALPRLFVHASAYGITPVGGPLTRYFTYGTDEIELEAAVPVDQELPEAGGIINSDLPGGLHATTVHAGPYEGIGAAYDAITDWVQANDYRVAGAPWEIYLTDPMEEKDPENWRTGVFFPIEPAS